MEEKIPRITRDELEKLIDTKGNYVLIDVREKEELTYGRIPTAKHLPLGEIKEAFQLPSKEFENKFHFSQPKKTDVIIFYCRTGSRSEFATTIATTLGYGKAKNFKGSIWEWAERDTNVKRY